MNALRIVGLWLSTAWRAAPWMTAGMCTCVILSSTLPAVSLLGISHAILAYSTRHSIWPGIALAAAALLLGAVADEVTWPLGDTVEDLVSRHVHDDLLRLTAEIPSIAHHEDPALADRIAMIEADVNALVGGPRLLETLGSVASTVTVVGLLASVRPELCVLLLVALLPAAVEVRGANKHNEVLLDNERYRRLTQQSVDVLTDPRQGLEVRCFGLGGPLLAVCKAAMRQRSRPQIAVTRHFAGYAAASWVVFGAAYALAVWWVVDGLQSGSSSVGDVSLLLLIGAQVISAGKAVTANARMVVDQMQVFSRYHWLREYSAQRRWRDGTRTPPALLRDGIHLRDVSFTYPVGLSDTSRRPALHSIDLHLPAGATVAFVGANGAGKSTLVKLLARLYDPTEGNVLVDGVPLTEFDPTRWRARISAGFQDYATFEFLAVDSIGVGNLAHRTDRARVASAAVDGQAQPVVASLPAGLDTQLGATFEGGVGLSGGQWQRLALARAFMRDRPLLMLLDEPTAALDPAAEQSLYEQYAATAHDLAATTGAVTVLVSHRFSTVRMADLIVVVENGRITEVGSHDELMHAGGHYARLFDLQARAYRH
ncbi:ABC transporter ATP-binding protein [Actinopolymorpha sp. B17G11]|uniref:ABC transporter ATP-binding protein n=1 Tax=Actinopolymorpha sp. B17G11 TaxID=3160861 RepID=UPI0032E3B039